MKKGDATMKTAVVYYSETGNTAKVGDAIARALREQMPADAGGDAVAGHTGHASGPVVVGPIQDEPSLDGADLVFVGMPIIRFGAPEPAQLFLEEECAVAASLSS